MVKQTRVYIHQVVDGERELEWFGYTNLSNEELSAIRERRKDLRSKGFDVRVYPVPAVVLYCAWLLEKCKEIEKAKSKFREMGE